MQDRDDKSREDLREWIMKLPADPLEIHYGFLERFELTRVIGRIIMVASAILFLASVCDLIFGIVSKWL